jgi:hypothetical protein
MAMRPAKALIPLCRSPFLQDLSIALGRRYLKSLRYYHSVLSFAVAVEEREGLYQERFDIEARDRLSSMTKITIWENGNAWVYRRLGYGKNLYAPAFEAHANLAGMDVEEVAELLRATLRDFDSTLRSWRDRAVV